MTSLISRFMVLFEFSVGQTQNCPRNCKNWHFLRDPGVTLSEPVRSVFVAEPGWSAPWEGKKSLKGLVFRSLALNSEFI